MCQRFLTFIIVLVTAFSACAQGKVTFGNDDTHLYSIGVPVSPDVPGNIPVSPLPSGLTLQSVLYAGTTAGSLTLQTTLILDAGGWLSDGRQVNKQVTLSGVPFGAVAYFQIFLLDTHATLPGTILGGSGYGINGTIYYGTTGLFTATPNGFTFPGLVSGGQAGSTWTGGLVTDYVPEPSVVALGLCGGIMLAFSRRN